MAIKCFANFSLPFPSELVLKFQRCSVSVVFSKEFFLKNCWFRYRKKLCIAPNIKKCKNIQTVVLKRRVKSDFRYNRKWVFHASKTLEKTVIVHEFPNKILDLAVRTYFVFYHPHQNGWCIIHFWQSCLSRGFVISIRSSLEVAKRQRQEKHKLFIGMIFPGKIHRVRAAA